MAIKISRPTHRGSFPQPPAPTLFRNIAVTFVLITVVVIGIALWTSSVRAKVVVQVTKEPVSVDTVIDISPSPTSQQIKGRVVNGTFVKAKEFEVQESAAPPTPVEPTKTSGRVKIINNYSKDQPLVVNTRILTADNKLFRIDKSVNVPSGGSVEVDATSDKEGFEFEIGSGVRLIIPGLWEGLRDKIYAETITQFTGEGGISGPRRIVTADAIAKAHEELYAAALDQAKETLVLEAGADPSWESVFLVTESQKQSNAAVGQNIDMFLAQVKVTVTAVFFPKEDVAAFIRTRLSEKLPDGYHLSDIDLEKILFRLEEADDSKGTARLAVTAEAESQLTGNSPAFKKDLIVGLPVDEVIRKWSALDGVEQVDVELHPSWVHRLPSMKDKIIIEIQ